MAPLVPVMAPAKLLSELLVVVKVLPPNARVPPLPERAATDSFPPKVKVPLLMATPDPELSRPAEPRVTVPVVTVILPVPRIALMFPPDSA
jgi:hypothetical protein